jgi:hypothetical protein
LDHSSFLPNFGGKNKRKASISEAEKYFF